VDLLAAADLSGGSIAPSMRTLRSRGLTRLLDTAYGEVNARIDANPDLRIRESRWQRADHRLTARQTGGTGQLESPADGSPRSPARGLPIASAFGIFPIFEHWRRRQRFFKG